MNKPLLIIVGAGMAGIIGATIAELQLSNHNYHQIQIIEQEDRLPVSTQYPAELFEIPAVDFQSTGILLHDAGMSPKEYGLRYGNGGSKRSNRLRLSHNAKLKRRVG